MSKLPSEQKIFLGQLDTQGKMVIDLSVPYEELKWEKVLATALTAWCIKSNETEWILPLKKTQSAKIE